MLFTEISFPLNTMLKLKKENNTKAIKKIAKNLCFIFLELNNSQIAIAKAAITKNITIDTMFNEIERDIKIFLTTQKEE